MLCFDDLTNLLRNQIQCCFLFSKSTFTTIKATLQLPLPLQQSHSAAATLLRSYILSNRQRIPLSHHSLIYIEQEKMQNPVFQNKNIGFLLHLQSTRTIPQDKATTTWRTCSLSMSYVLCSKLLSLCLFALNIVNLLLFWEAFVGGFCFCIWTFRGGLELAMCIFVIWLLQRAYNRVIVRKSY